ncbi:helix-turn-helix domain-containing protein [Pseudothermotoga thermarum]|uniref:HTH cro/C1-type domain-containing protein n=1 Tax=Pseudothermotoga thermarum DSM 5069 TaxID=688269 RepID=F7YWQ7_9THEM|nr:helix-turn-helix domain-containing protein [Pseudothermotoga thermarum]AEH52047.1 hypothetical protein Theth_2009 [Pseudothermotoga thermarum DSM 5069]
MEKWKTIGEKLKNAREEKDLSVEQVAEALKIPAWKIRMIEEGAFDRVDAPFYVKQYIKEYATLVGLKPEEILEVYEPKKVEPKPTSKSFLNGDLGKFLLVGLFAASLIFFVYSGYNFFKTLKNMNIKFINLSNDVVYFEGLALNPNETVLLQVGKRYKVTNNKGVCAIRTMSKEWRILAENFEVIVWEK